LRASIRACHAAATTQMAAMASDPPIATGLPLCQMPIPAQQAAPASQDTERLFHFTVNRPLQTQ